MAIVLCLILNWPLKGILNGNKLYSANSRGSIHFFYYYFLMSRHGSHWLDTKMGLATGPGWLQIDYTTSVTVICGLSFQKKVALNLIIFYSDFDHKRV